MTSTAIRMVNFEFLIPVFSQNKRRAVSPTKKSKLKTKFLRARCDAQDLAALVITASRTDPVRHIGRGALRAGAQLRQF
jgi:hypothetical protein